MRRCYLVPVTEEVRSPGPASAGRRERKKRHTRARIQDAAWELFAERGYRETTIVAIADRADVATRTVTLHFPVKEDLLFADDPFTPESLRRHLREPGAGPDTLAIVREWMRATMLAVEAEDAEQPGHPARAWQRRSLRARLLMDDDDLRGRARAGYRELEQLVAQGVAADLGQSADALVPRLAALTVVGGLREIYVTREGRERTIASARDLFDLVDRVLGFARAGIAATG